MNSDQNENVLKPEFSEYTQPRYNSKSIRSFNDSKKWLRCDKIVISDSIWIYSWNLYLNWFKIRCSFTSKICHERKGTEFLTKQNQFPIFNIKSFESDLHWLRIHTSILNKNCSWHFGNRCAGWILFPYFSSFSSSLSWFIVLGSINSIIFALQTMNINMINVQKWILLTEWWIYFIIR